MKFRSVEEVKQSRRKGTPFHLVFDQLLTSPELLSESHLNPFLLLKEAGFQLTSEDFLDMTTRTWKQLKRNVQTQYATIYQQWYAESQKLPVEKNVPLGNNVFLTMVLIPPGKFFFGESSVLEIPGFPVISEQPLPFYLKHAFWCGKYAVTQRQWIQLMGENPSFFNDEKTKNALDRPVEEVNWFDCKNFTQKLGMRLLAEFEWEYACRAGTLDPFFWGQDITTEQVNYNGRYPYLRNSKKGEDRRCTIVVGSLPANAWGLHEMHGNVNEWCENAYEGDEKLMHIPLESFPENASDRVIRGGSWIEPASYCLSGSRRRAPLDLTNFHLGFRLAQAQPP